MHFPKCTVGSRWLNNLKKEMADHLIRTLLQDYELWHDHVRLNGYGLKAMAVDFPSSLARDIGVFLTWDEVKL